MPEPTEQANPTDPTAPADPGEQGNGTDPGETPADPAALAAELDKWKALARANEQRAKANHAELEKLRTAGMSDTEKAVAEARQQGRTEGLRETSTKLARQTLATELATVPGGRRLAESIDPAPFIGEDGTVDDTAVAEWAAAYRAEIGPIGARPAPFDIGQGSRSNLTPTPTNPLAEALARAVGRA